MKKLLVAGAVALAAFSGQALAVSVNWTDWQAAADGSTTVNGTIDVGGETIAVTYTGGPVNFVQSGSGTDYFATGAFSSSRNPATSSFTSKGPNGNDNIPTAAEMISLNLGGSRTLSFSKPVEGLYFSYISTNRNTLAFDTDFEILSNTGQNFDGAGIDASGYWGSASVSKSTAGSTFDLVSPGEAHGTLFFGSPLTELMFTTGTENWHGFTVGVADLADPIPLPGAALLFAPLAAGFVARRRKKAQA